MKRLIYSLSFLLVVFSSLAQEIKPYTYFIQDSMELAEPVQMSLSVSYPSDFTLLFPDSSYNYGPFEFRSKKYFTTQTDSLISKDSVIFTLASFELEPIQKLRLAVFIVKDDQKIPVYSNTDSIFFQEKIASVVDSLHALQQVAPLTVKKEFNYPYLIIGLVILAIVSLIVIFLFGKKLVTIFRLYQLRKKQEKFLDQFIISKELDDRDEIDRLYKKWKLHLEYLTKKPFSRLTTKEIYSITQNDSLKSHLQSIDRFIYSSKVKPLEMNQNFEFLKEDAINNYQNRIKQLKQYGAN